MKAVKLTCRPYDSKATKKLNAGSLGRHNRAPCAIFLLHIKLSAEDSRAPLKSLATFCTHGLSKRQAKQSRRKEKGGSGNGYGYGNGNGNGKWKCSWVHRGLHTLLERVLPGNRNIKNTAVILQPTECVHPMMVG